MIQDDLHDACRVRWQEVERTQIGRVITSADTEACEAVMCAECRAILDVMTRRVEAAVAFRRASGLTLND